MHEQPTFILIQRCAQLNSIQSFSFFSICSVRIIENFIIYSENDCVLECFPRADIDECERYKSRRPCRSKSCVNIPGSYRCVDQCRQGYEMVNSVCKGKSFFIHQHSSLLPHSDHSNSLRILSHVRLILMCEHF